MIMRQFRNAKRVESIDAWLVRLFKKGRKQRFCGRRIKPPVRVVRSEMPGRSRGDIAFIEFRVVEGDTERAQRRLGQARGQGNDRGRVDPTTQEYAHRHVAH